MPKRHLSISVTLKMSNGIEVIRSTEEIKLVNTGNRGLLQFIINVRDPFCMEMARLILERGVVDYHVNLFLTFKEYIPLRTPVGGFMWGERLRSLSFGTPTMTAATVCGMEQYFDDYILKYIIFNLERYLQDVPNRDMVSVDEVRVVVFRDDDNVNNNFKNLSIKKGDGPNNGDNNDKMKKKKLIKS